MILVAGCRGMLGSDLLELFGSEARGVYRDELDITDPVSIAATLEKFRPRVVINAVAFTDVDRCETEAAAALRVNGEGVANLAAATRSAGSKLVQISSDYVFAGNNGTPYLEDDPVDPMSSYGRSKLAGEESARINPDHLVIRTQWLYGRHGKNFVETMLRLAAEKDEIGVVDDQIGSPTWTRELSLAIRALVAHDCRGTYHAANSGWCSWYEFARAIFEERGLGVKLKPITTRELGRPAPRPAYSVLDCGKLFSDTGLRMDNWRRALRNYLKEREG
jgi:dTDP-4-dehydrorhamnose reductase